MNNELNERVLYDSSVMLRRVAASLADMGLSASENRETDEEGPFWKERTLLVTNNQSEAGSTDTPQVSDA
jgi:hypothetical protein